MSGGKNEANDSSSSSSQNSGGAQLAPYGVPNLSQFPWLNQSYNQPPLQPKTEAQVIGDSTVAGVDSLAKAGVSIVASIAELKKAEVARQTQEDANKTKIKISEHETTRLEKAIAFQKDENAKQRKIYKKELKLKWGVLNKFLDNVHLEVDKTLSLQESSLALQKDVYDKLDLREKAIIAVYQQIALECAKNKLEVPPPPQAARIEFKHLEMPKQSGLLEFAQILSSQKSSSQKHGAFFKQPMATIEGKKQSEPLVIDGYAIKDEQPSGISQDNN